MAMKLNQVLCILGLVFQVALALETHPSTSAHLQVKQKILDSLHRSNARITPELDPLSDKKFFKKDYPDDNRAPTFHHFDHPYPEVQDSDHYDKDYVQDENDDKGEWAAQWGYDSKKNELMKQQNQLRSALDKQLKEKREWEAAVEAEKKAEADARAAEARLKDAEAHEANMEGEHRNLNNTIDSKADEVEKEVKDLEDCKKQLMKARKELKSLLEEKANAKKDEEHAEGEEDSAEDSEMSAEKKEELAEKAVAEEHKEYKDASKQVEKEKKDVKQAEEDLEAAAKKLRKFRTADQDGGVYSVKSSAAEGILMLPLALVSALFLQTLF